jgi:hypothetical protein
MNGESGEMRVKREELRGEKGRKIENNFSSLLSTLYMKVICSYLQLFAVICISSRCQKNMYYLRSVKG